MDFNSQIIKINNILQNDMSLVNKIIMEKMQSDVPLITTIGSYIINAGGKRIRPILTLMGAKIFNYSGDYHLLLAACIEFIHTATLLHDDIVDENHTRRGLPTSNSIWSNQSCILVGDYLFSKSFELMVEANSLEILKMLSQSSSTIASGEVLQLSNLNNINLTIDEYIRIIFSKTASLFSASTKVGAILCNKNDEYKIAMENYGSNLGLAFQIFDDILDYSSTQQELGKEIGVDFNEGKVTLPIIFLLQSATNEEKENITNIFQSQQSHTNELIFILNLLKKYNIYEKCHILAKKYAQNAIDSINIIPDDGIYKQLFIDMAISSINRKF